ncbi:MAG: hypothetical protein AABY64_12380 [Bdellovibrionota bacterium]
MKSILIAMLLISSTGFANNECSNATVKVFECGSGLKHDQPYVIVAKLIRISDGVTITRSLVARFDDLPTCRDGAIQANRQK